MCIQQMQNYKIQPSPVYVLLCVQPGKYKICTNTKILLCVQPGAYRRSHCPAADSTQSGEEPRQKSLLCSKMDKVELENRVELESKLHISRVELENTVELENRVELEKQLADLQSRVGAELKMCGVQFVLQLMMSREENQQRSRVSSEQSRNMWSS